MVPRWLTRPVIPALIIWLLGLSVVFLVVDLSIMPAFAGRFSRTVVVPSVQGYDIERAKDTLKAHGLRFEVDTLSDFSRTVPRGRILSQRPDSGAVVKGGRRVWAMLSRGRPGSPPLVRPSKDP